MRLFVGKHRRNTEMSPVAKTAIYLALFIFNLLLIVICKTPEFADYLVFSLSFILFPLLVLSLLDDLPSLRKNIRLMNLPEKSPTRTLLTIHNILLGLLSLLIGLSIVAWVLYNSFIELDASYSGPDVITSFSSFGIGLPMIYFGWRWLRQALAVHESLKQAKKDIVDDK